MTPIHVVRLMLDSAMGGLAICWVVASFIGLNVAFCDLLRRSDQRSGMRHLCRPGFWMVVSVVMICIGFNWVGLIIRDMIG